MKVYVIFVPLYLNDGAPIDGDVLKSLTDVLLNEFGGVSPSRIRDIGRWGMSCSVTTL
jgi:hypothetical protein